MEFEVDNKKKNISTQYKTLNMFKTSGRQSEMEENRGAGAECFWEKRWRWWRTKDELLKQ